MALNWIIIISAILPLIIGLLLGFMRGSRRAVLRILLVLLCVVLAFCLKDVITLKLLETEIDGQTVQEMIAAQLPPEYADVVDVMMPVIVLIFTSVSFLALFFVIKFITWAIVFPICKIFVKKARKKKDGTYGSKHSLIGGVVGLAQGAVVAFVLCVMLNGIFVNVANIAEAMNESGGSQNGTEQAAVMTAEEGAPSDGSSDATFDSLLADLIAYKDSTACKFASGLSFNGKAFDLVASMKTEEGKTLTLSGQIDALSGILKMGQSLAELENINFDGGISASNAEDIVNIFNKLDAINAELSVESKETINRIIQTVADNFMPDSDIDLSVLDFTTVSFANEGQVIADLSVYKDVDFTALNETEAKQKATDIVETVLKSDIILPVLSANPDFTIGLDKEGEGYELAKEVIEELSSKPDVDQSKVDMLKSFFGLNDAPAN